MTSTVKPFLYHVKKERDGLELITAIKKQVDRKTNTCLCGEQMTLKSSPKEYPYNVGETEKRLIVLKAPYFECESCGRKTEDVFLYADVEKAIENEIFYKLNKREPIPEKVDFSVFVSTDVEK